MATKIHMEALSPTMEEGQLVSWLKGEGDSVSNGDIIAEIETDKATMELVARGDGVLRKIFLPEGGVAAVGEVIGVIAAADEDISDISGTSGSGGTPTPPAEEPSESPPEPATPTPTAVSPAPAEAAAPAPASGARVKASPLARRMANERGVDLAAVTGSGPGGRIVKRDIESAATQRRSTPAATPAAVPAAPVMTFDGPEYEDIPLSQVRKTIARRLSESIGPVPHYFLNIHVDMTRAMAARRSMNRMLEAAGEKVSLNDLIIRATASALVRHPDCNAHWLGDHIRRFNRVHIGVAVAIEDGLITPVIRDAHAKGVAEIAREVRDKAARAREKRLKPDEYTGSTFSVSNLGMFGIYEFTAVINPPEAGILAIGGIEDVPVSDSKGGFDFVPRMKVTMSCDHRTIDGATGARFLQTFKAMLEEPGIALL